LLHLFIVGRKAFIVLICMTFHLLICKKFETSPAPL